MGRKPSERERLIDISEAVCESIEMLIGCCATKADAKRVMDVVYEAEMFRIDTRWRYVRAKGDNGHKEACRMALAATLTAAGALPR